MITEKMIEAGARAMCAIDHLSPDVIVSDFSSFRGKPLWHTYAAKVRAALEAAERAAWRPIGEARKDGSRFLACGGGLDGVESVSWNERVGAWNAETATLDDCDHEPDGYNRPTHFRPLPSPPEAPKGS